MCISQVARLSLRCALVLCAFVLLPFAAAAEEARPRKISLIAGDPDGHPANTHEYAKSVALIKTCLETSPNAKGFIIEAHTGGWPKDESTLDTADTIVLITSGSDRVETNHPLLVGNRMLAVEKQMNRGCGLMTFHYSTFAPNKIGQRILEWIGGYFDYQSGPAANGWYSKIQFWNAEAKLPSPDHPISRGVKPFQVNEEFYYNIRFIDKDPRLTPIVAVRAPGEDQDHTVGWAIERKNGGRGFGFTGGHPFENWKNDDFRGLILNAILWTAHVEVPEEGVQSQINDDKGSIKTVIVTGHQYPGHPWRETTLALEDAFRKDPRLVVTSVPDAEFLAKPELHDYQVVVLNYCNWEKPGLSDAAKENFIKYLQAGGGLVIVHFTNGTWHYSLPNNPGTDWPEWRTQICRRVWDHDGARQPSDKKSQHDAYGSFRVEIAKDDHPITQGMEPFETTDELYFDQQGTEPIEVLATARSKISGQDAPMAFVYEYGKGSVFQTVLGHDAAALKTPGTAQLVRRGTLWAAGAKLEAADKLVPPSATEATEGKFGRALDARRDGLAVKPNAAYHTPPWTVECWAKVEAGGFNILVAQSAKESNKHWELFTWHDDGTLTAYLPGCAPDHVRSTARVADGKWHYLAMTFDGTKSKLFVDGKQVAEAEIKCHEGRGSTGPLWIGAYPPGAIGCNGFIDEVRISNTIRKIEGVPSEPFKADDQTIGLWRFDGKTSSPVTDESSLKADAVSLSATEPAQQAEDHFFGWQETEGHDDRWQKTDTGPYFSGTIRNKEQVTARALCVRVGDKRQAAVMYDATTMQAVCGWTGKFLNFDPGRFGLIGMPSVAGEVQEFEKTEWLVDGKMVIPKYRGLHLHGNRVTLAYTVGDILVLESPWLKSQDDRTITRSLEIGPHRSQLTLNIGGQLIRAWPPTDHSERLTYSPLDGNRFEIADRTEDLTALSKPGPPRWTEPIITQGKLGDGKGAYVVDTLALPFENPYGALLFTSGLDFFANGDAALCTAHGDVWLVRGIDNSLARLEWRRFATGLYQPLGLKIVDDKIHVLGRDQITRLDDLNRDGEADYYHNFNSDSPTSAGGHDYSTCLETDRAGNFYFLHAIDGLVRVSPDGTKREVIATGFRNPNGMGIGPNDEITVAPQEGNWTPASSIIAVKPSGYYGFGGPKITPDRPLGYDPPMVWLPRPLDNSSGGQVWTTSDRFGPLGNQLLHLSYGRSSMMLVLRDEVNGIKQGAVVPLPLQFNSGIMRGRMNPKDGQLYLVGQQGWVSNAVNDGCFERVRYTGGNTQLPIGIKYHDDGIAISFACNLQKETAEDVGNYSLEGWNYRYAADYGSPDYKLSGTNEEGHDELNIRAAKLLDNGTTVFLAVESLRPMMQFQLGCSLMTDTRYSFESMVAGTIHQLHRARFQPHELVAKAPHLSLPPDVEARLKPGLMVQYQSNSSSVDADCTVRDANVRRLAGFYHWYHEQVRLVKDAWGTVVISGFIRSPTRSQYWLHNGGWGNASIEVNSSQVAKQSMFHPTALGKGNHTPSVVLEKGLNRIRIEYVCTDPVDHPTFSLGWSSKKFAVEPIPPTALFHDPQEPVLQKFQAVHQGRELFAERMCIRCHAQAELPVTAMPELSKLGPSLTNVGRRLNTQWLADWLTEPKRFNSKATMPPLFDTSNAEDSQALADVVAYLTTTGAPLDATAAKAGSIELGEEKFERLGCIACHTVGQAADPDTYGRHSLRHVSAKFKPNALVNYLQKPHAHYEWNPMPDFGLSRDEATSLAAYLTHNSDGDARQYANTGDAGRGKLAFARRCAQCHAIGENPSLPTSVPLPGKTADNGCLAVDRTQRGNSPRFDLSDLQRQQLQAFLATGLEVLNHDASIDRSARLMKQFRCQACHARDGVSGDFAKIVLEEGSTGLPPDAVPNLTWAGEKLQVDWMERLLSGKVEHRSRPWLDVRMPAFPPAVAKAIAHGMSAEHGLPPIDAFVHPVDENFAEEETLTPAQLVEIGKTLSEKNGGLDCRQCHSQEHLTPRQPNDAQGISFLHVPERIRRGYYDRWMRDPLRIDPATKMPKFAQDGQHTVLKTILEGNAEKQFDALWHYLQSIPAETITENASSGQTKRTIPGARNLSD